MDEQLKKKISYLFWVVVLIVIIIFESTESAGDLSIFLSAAQDLLQKKNIYTILYNEWYHYYYDVSFALILIPFTYLPLTLVKLIWLFFNAFFLYRIWKIFLDWLPMKIFAASKNSELIFVNLSLLFILSFVRDNLHLAQVTIFIFYLALEGLSLIQQKHFIAGGLLLALGINIKLLPIVILPYLIYRAEWKALAYTLSFVALFLIIPGIFIGHDYNMMLLNERWLLINPTNTAHVLDTSERSFHSLTTLLATLLVEDCGDYHALSLKRNIADISISNLNIIINVTRLFFVALMLYFLNSRPFQKASSKIQMFYELSYLFLLIPLIFPHQQFYAFFFIFPATTYLLYFMLQRFYSSSKITSSSSRTKRNTFVLFMTLVYFLTNSHFILGAFNDIYDHYKTLTYGALIIILLLAICRPDKIISNPSNNTQVE